MSLPHPKPGMVIRYSFLWSHERENGLEEGDKDRPSAIVVATPKGREGEIRTVVAPITHVPPADPNASIEIPPDVCRTLGLDSQRQWLRLDQLNSFVWPGFDLRPIPDQPASYSYGMLPRDLFERLRDGILKLHRARKVREISRD